MQCLENNIYMLHCLHAGKLFSAGRTAESKIAGSIYAPSAEALFASCYVLAVLVQSRIFSSTTKKHTRKKNKNKPKNSKGQ